MNEREQSAPPQTSQGEAVIRQMLEFIRQMADLLGPTSQIAYEAREYLLQWESLLQGRPSPTDQALLPASVPRMSAAMQQRAETARHAFVSVPLSEAEQRPDPDYDAVYPAPAPEILEGSRQPE